MPEAGPDGVLSLGLNVALVQLGDSKILIDPGYGDPSPDSPVEGNVTRSPGLRVAFESLGLRFDRITHVLITHPHHDHIGGLTTVEHGAGKPASHTPATFSIARIGRATPSKYSKSHPLPSILERSMRSVCST
jgi:glyoxylase-like metal-dependent hydrolase (beta-lactamase superfamily II)